MVANMPQEGDGRILWEMVAMIVAGIPDTQLVSFGETYIQVLRRYESTQKMLIYEYRSNAFNDYLAYTEQERSEFVSDVCALFNQYTSSLETLNTLPIEGIKLWVSGEIPLPESS